MSKKIFIKIVAVLLIAGISPLQAQAPYKKSIGGVVGNMEGVSYKMFLADRLAFQSDLGVKFTATQFGHEPDYDFPVSFTTLEINPHVMFENNIKSSETGQWLWFIGIGTSIGYQFENNGKFGVNLIGGFEYALAKTPLALQIDYRPGYGLLFNSHASQAYFDWGLAFSIRYTF